MPNNNKDEAEAFYSKILKIINSSNIPFMIGGGLAVNKYTNIKYPVKDLDIFCKAGDYPKILNELEKSGVEIKILDERWLAQAWYKTYNVDLLFASPNYITKVDDSWFEHAQDLTLYGSKVKVIPKEELVWCKAYVQDRGRFDGADINHIILFSGKQFDWKRLLMRMENHWEILFSILINFRFVYPSERSIIPNWLIKELVTRLLNQINNPIPRDRISRGPLLSRTQYKIDLTDFGFEVIL